jgi:DNA mismatch endonuclease (patch repair protein)
VQSKKSLSARASLAENKSPPSPMRSDLMSRVRAKNTKPEIIVRRAVHALGYRFRLHRRDLPGCPDLVFPARKKVIFVNGCFWHRHPGCRMASTPKTRAEFWNAKFNRNIQRDADAISVLEKSGWACLVIWECETQDSIMLAHYLRNFI